MKNIILFLAFLVAFSGSAQIKPNRFSTNSDSVASSLVRLISTNSFTYYVSTTGSDSNDGLTPSTPFLTPQKAVNKALAWDFGTNNITIQMADGSYSGSILAAQQLGTADWKSKGGFLVLHGNDASPSSVVITNASTNHLILASQGTRMIVASMALGSTNVPNANLLDSQLFSYIGISNLVIGAAGASAPQITCESSSHFAYLGSNTIVSGSCLAHLLVIGDSEAWVTSSNAVTGTPSYSIAFIQAYGSGTVFLSHGGFVGSATCPKFNLFGAGSIINFESSTPEALISGNSAGTQDARLAEDSSTSIYTGTNGFLGVTDGGAAASGVIGEYMQVLVPFGSATNLINNIPTNVMTLTLTAGDWDVQANLNVDFASTTETKGRAGISTISSTTPVDGSGCFSAVQLTTTSTSDTITIPMKRISVNSSTTVYLVANFSFSAGTVTAYGGMTARRAR